MSQARVENLCPSAHLRVILPSSMDSSLPPPFIDINNIHDIPPPQADFLAPPPYDVAANSKLPTYEEVQREKQLEGEGQLTMQPPNHPTIAAFVTVEQPEGSAEQLDPENSLLGTDIMFLTSFFVAFLFNWIGFLLLMCFCHTVASRYGALAGFGLSLAKWTLIVKHSTELASHENSWLWWLIMAFDLKVPSQIKLLSCLIPARGLNKRRKFSTLECVENFIIDVQNPGDIQTKIDEVKVFYAASKLTYMSTKWHAEIRLKDMTVHQAPNSVSILICVRAVIQYLNIKRGWRLLSGTAQERLLFFY